MHTSRDDRADEEDVAPLLERDPDATSAAVRRVLARLRALQEGLDPLERAVLATLLAPGLARAHTPAGPDHPGWLPSQLPEAVADAVRADGEDRSDTTC